MVSAHSTAVKAADAQIIGCRPKPHAVFVIRVVAKRDQDLLLTGSAHVGGNILESAYHYVISRKSLRKICDGNGFLHLKVDRKSMTMEDRRLQHL